jgi:predicted transcriptional regulator
MLGPLEAEVMKIIWVRGTALVSEIEEILNRRRNVPLAYKTVLTICTRLGEKGVLSHEKEGRAFRFYPTMTESEFVAAQASKATAALGYFGPMNRSMAPWSSKNTVIASILSAALKRTTVR